MREPGVKKLNIVTLEADSAAELLSLLATLGTAARAGNRLENELSAQLEQMRFSQTELKDSIMNSLDQILENVQRQRSTVDSVTAFISGLEQRLRDVVSGADPQTQQKMQAITDELNAQRQALADAIDNDPNTPAQPQQPQQPPADNQGNIGKVGTI